ncbi:cardiolipin synthase [Pseudalkalibacillus hwajinpoensis]|uniref:Cardiolipin synthase n=1 Tax=Guptibacillus hwajinpoensis TaxID=208199 RepID=A0A4U1MDF5_9BACL|nr:cardiolipin synthase [Pseudalkalibacillus hwajinpoensis]TKD68757.1 cardiolipin synthase [Pseudalkalibacillus hwajinpoensis]
MKQTRQIIFFIVMTSSLSIIFFTSLSPQWKWISGITYSVILLSIIFVLLLEGRSPYKTLLWIYVLIFFPIIGYVFFLFSGQLEVKGHLFKEKRSNGLKFFQQYVNFPPSEHWNELSERNQNFSNLIATMVSSPISMRSSTKLLLNGSQTFSSIKEEIQKAETYIHMEYYTFRSDELGKSIIDLLIEKARKGVEVRVLYDSIGSHNLSKASKKALREAGASVQQFLPIKYGFFNQTVNFRNHRKIIVIDGKTGFVGGLNIGDEYAGDMNNMRFWRDTHVLVKGEVLSALHAVFLMDWFYMCGEELNTTKYLEMYEVKGDGGTQLVASGPDTKRGAMSDLYFSLITSAQERIWIATPYFVPNKAIRTALAMAAMRGIQVRLIVPEVSDGFLTQYGTRSYFSELLDYGVEIYMYQKGFLHQKIMIIDEDIATIGTANMDMRSMNLNFEVNLFLFQASTVNDLVEAYKNDINDSVKVTKDSYSKRGLKHRTKESFARLFSPVL